MRTIFTIVLVVGVAVAAAEPPRKHPLTRYRNMWTNSLVTEKPIPELKDAEEEPTPLDDYTLGGWTRTTQGYVVSLINTKDRKQRVTLAPGLPAPEGFGNARVKDIRSNPADYKATEVLVVVNSKEKWIGYDDKFLNLQRPAVAKTPQKPQTTNRARTPVPTNNNQNNNNTNRRTPRVRRVPTPPKR